MTTFISIIIVAYIFGFFSKSKKDNFPIILQDSITQCGPICLQMIAKHYGLCSDLKTLQKQSGMTIEGTSLEGLSQAADFIGLKNLAVRISLDVLVKDAPLPAIAHWNEESFVVIYKATHKKIWVADPAIGKVVFSHKDFLESWIQTEQGGILFLLELK